MKRKKMFNLKQQELMSLFIVIILYMVLFNELKTLYKSKNMKIKKISIPCDQIPVEIQGEVINDGIYTFKKGIILGEALTKAGILLDKVNISRKDLTKKLVNGI